MLSKVSYSPRGHCKYVFSQTKGNHKMTQPVIIKIVEH